MARLGRAYTRLSRFIRPHGGTATGRTKPTFVSSASTSWNTTGSPKTLSVTWQTGDVIVVGALCADDAIATMGDVTATGLTFTLQADIRTGSHSIMKMWTAVAAAAGTQNFSLSMTINPTPAPFGFHVMVFRDSDGVGIADWSASSGSPNRNITPTDANSAIVVVNADWLAVSGAIRIWTTAVVTPTAINGLERDYFNSANYTTYAAYYDDVAEVAVRTVGLSQPGGQAYSIGIVEVLGAAEGAGGVGVTESWGSVLM